MPVELGRADPRARIGRWEHTGVDRGHDALDDTHGPRLLLGRDHAGQEFDLGRLRLADIQPSAAICACFSPFSTRLAMSVLSSAVSAVLFFRLFALGFGPRFLLVLPAPVLLVASCSASQSRTVSRGAGGGRERDGAGGPRLPRGPTPTPARRANRGFRCVSRAVHARQCR